LKSKQIFTQKRDAVERGGVEPPHRSLFPGNSHTGGSAHWWFVLRHLCKCWPTLGLYVGYWIVYVGLCGVSCCGNCATPAIGCTQEGRAF